MDVREILAFNMRTLRSARGMSQEALADAAEIDRTYVSSLERCQYSATIDTAQRIATALGVTLDTLLRMPE
ncbi:helix-turn-helix transcriptional regulator [Sphingomonas sp. AP4-R1]|nr:helix-turn-helix transcriptional regulator [Sphingomonas sp. AP4-R1]